MPPLSGSVPHGLHVARGDCSSQHLPHRHLKLQVEVKESGMRHCLQHACQRHPGLQGLSDRPHGGVINRNVSSSLRCCSSCWGRWRRSLLSLHGCPKLLQISLEPLKSLPSRCRLCSLPSCRCGCCWCRCCPPCTLLTISADSAERARGIWKALVMREVLSFVQTNTAQKAKMCAASARHEIATVNALTPHATAWTSRKGISQDTMKLKSRPVLCTCHWSVCMLSTDCAKTDSAMRASALVKTCWHKYNATIRCRALHSLGILGLLECPLSCS
mmetsp:Transcript_116878/g.342258  ORF Transcript_116878/g.342258 Transcript_116878/m.342258 type:complete len:273 (+) Transcript_116878:520-1338(+)